MELQCPNCDLTFECEVPSPDCWCKGVAPWEGVHREVREIYGTECLCKGCLSVTAYHPSTLETAWGLPPMQIHRMKYPPKQL